MGVIGVLYILICTYLFFTKFIVQLYPNILFEKCFKNNTPILYVKDIRYILRKMIYFHNYFLLNFTLNNNLIGYIIDLKYYI